jgi:hypothetical protein
MKSTKKNGGTDTNKIQTEKVRRIMKGFQVMRAEHEVGGWVEEDGIYLLVGSRTVTAPAEGHVSSG